jgi:cytosine/creatinine deaminase
MTAFKSIDIPERRSYALRRARVPACLLASPPAAVPADSDGGLLVDIEIENERIARIAPADAANPLPGVDLAGRHVWPTLVDLHTHLDKGHIVDRTVNPDGSFLGARLAATEDRTRYWRRDDVYRRMSFGLRCAEVHGVSAIRTHIDSYEGQGDLTWAVVREIREEWKDRIALQAVGLVPLDTYREPGGYGDHLADVVAKSGGIIGGVTRPGAGGHSDHLPDLDALLDRVFRLATERDLDIDLHVDETGDPAAATLRNVAEATLRHGYQGRVTCGHCCSLAVQDADNVARTIDLVAEARITIVSLPTVNMYLQDRTGGRTPRWRGVTVIHELRAKGVRVALAGDNCRDPFYAYGDHDVLDTFRQGVRIAHLDHPIGEAPALVTRNPAATTSLDHGVLREKGPARFIIFNARTLNEIVSRPHADRIVVVNGQRLTRLLPDYGELDFVAAAKPFPRAAELAPAPDAAAE